MALLLILFNAIIPTLEPWREDHPARHPDNTRKHSKAHRAYRAWIGPDHISLNAGYRLWFWRRKRLRVNLHRIMHLIGMTFIAGTKFDSEAVIANSMTLAGLGQSRAQVAIRAGKLFRRML